MAEPRTLAQRRTDTLAKLTAPVADAWVATTDGTEPFLVPLAIAWWEERIVLATAEASPTVRNLVANGRARLTLGPTRDVVRITATLERVLPAASSGEAGAAFAAQNDWDPRGTPYVVPILRPRRIEAWREENELAGRHVMRDGAWL